MRRAADVVRTCEAPTEDDEPVFETPWEARIFGLTAQLVDAGLLGWEDFRRRLVVELEQEDRHPGVQTEGTAYYRAWMAATESLLSSEALCSSDELERRIVALSDHRAPGKVSPTGSSARPVAED